MTRHPAPLPGASRIPARLRENIAVHDITDCLIEAYDCVARLAYEKFVARGAQAGGELDDWLTAEHELLDNLPADIQDSGENITALVSVPGLHAAQIKIGIESRWLVIVSRRSSARDGDRENDAGKYTRHGDAAANPENHTEEGGRGMDGRDPDARDPDDEACDEIEAEKVAEFSRAVHGYRQRERNGAGSIGPCDDLHGSRRILDVNTFVGRALSREGLVVERKCDEPANRAAGRNGEPASDEKSGHYELLAKPSKPPPQLFAILELPAEVDASRAIAVLADGLLGLRMPKILASGE